MESEPCTSSQERAEDSTQTSSSGIGPCVRWNSKNTASLVSKLAKRKAGGQTSKSGREMSGHSIPPSTRDEWIQSMRASLARTSLWLAEAQASTGENEVASGRRSCDAFASYDPDSRSWKTAQLSFLGGYTLYSETWPTSGMMRDGRSYQLPQSVPPTFGRGGGACVPTPCNTDANPITGGDLYVSETGSVRARNKDGSSSNRGLCATVALWQTPVSDDAVERETGKHNSRGEPKLSAQVKMWPTPTKASADKEVCRSAKGQTLIGAVAAAGDKVGTQEMFPSPAARDWRSGKGRNMDNGHTPQLPEVIGGQLNPAWVEWLMGFCIGWTDCERSAMPSFRQWLRAHSCASLTAFRSCPQMPRPGSAQAEKPSK